jgi:hypothetical protein
MIGRFIHYWIQRLFVGIVENVTFTNCEILERREYGAVDRRIGNGSVCVRENETVFYKTDEGDSKNVRTI